MDRIAKLAWSALVLNVVVILGGALVRATGSGAGCGRSWPTCEGQLVPAEISGALAIEFSHRLLSGIALITVGALFFAIRRRVPTDGTRLERQLRASAAWALATIIGEALIGAGIVLFEWVNDDSSIARTVAVPLHLVNTFLLLGALSLVVWLAGSRRAIAFERRSHAIQWGFGLLVLVAATGAVTALADTLFPKESIGISEIGTAEAFLTNLRVIHPAVAAAVSLVLVRIVWSPDRVRSGRVGLFAGWVAGIVALQLVAGVLNVLLLVPVWMQLVHLALADALWISFVWYSAEVLSSDVVSATGSVRSSG